MSIQLGERKNQKDKWFHFHVATRKTSESVKCRFSKCRFSALNLKFDFISDGGCTRRKQIQKALGSLPPCGNRCRFSESAICSSRVHPPSEIKSNFTFKTLRWRPRRWRLTLSENLALRRIQGNGPLRSENGPLRRRNGPLRPWCRFVLWVHRKFPQSTVEQVLPSNESYESKTGCNRTLATVLWVPLN